MSFRALLNKITLAPRDAEVIFDRHEPVGTPTDLVMPRKRRSRAKERLNKTHCSDASDESHSK